VKGKKARQEEKKKEKGATAAGNPPFEQQKFIMARDHKVQELKKEDDDILSAINRALHAAKVPSFIRFKEVRRNAHGTVTAVTTDTCTAIMMLEHRNTVIRAAKSVDSVTIGLDTNETWQRVRIYGIPLERYVGKGTHGLEKLREEMEAENDGLRFPMQVRWLGRLEDIKKRWKEGKIASSSVTFAVRGDAEAKRLVKEGIRVCGKKMEVDWYVEAKPDTQCKVCSGWGHIEEKFASPPRCNICAAGHRTDQHQCDVTGCTTKRGNVCAHTNAKCPNCRGAHIGTARECLKKRQSYRPRSGGGPVGKPTLGKARRRRRGGEARSD